jgi:hypothetical protein
LKTAVSGEAISDYEGAIV